MGLGATVPGLMAPPEIPDDPLDWRPQQPLVTRVPVPIRDPVVEPLWTGERVLVHVDHPDGAAIRVRIIDRFGIDLAPVDADVASAIGGATLAHDAVIDGVLTDQATREGIGTAIVPEAHVSFMGTLFGSSIAGDPGVTVERREPVAAAETPEAFVAFDLLRVDEQSLLDVPLLERRRLLESVLEQGERVRVSVLCRPPVDAWVATWQASGLRGAMLKAANGRYIPGDRTPEWREVTKVAARR
jgi:ATP-dependent DNA ligase